MMQFIRNLWNNNEGAIAPLVALSLIALVAVGGIAFDYAHLAAMDTELQDAADHAALAAATQLDGTSGSRDRATAAANELIRNETRFAKDDASHNRTVGVAEVTFYSAYTSRTSNTPATGDDDAMVAEVQVDTRTADYAFTPIVGALYGSLDAKAVAGVSSAICGVVPFFVCNPAEPVGNKNPDYPVTVASGIGVQMLEGGQQKGPGNFGFLAYAGRGAKNLEEALSTDALKDDCLATDSAGTVTTEPGQKTSVFDGINRRFDMVTDCPDAPCSSSTNETKDLVRQSGSCNWKENPATLASLSTTAPQRYRPTSATVPLASNVTPEIMGHPRDMCHAVSNAGACPNGQIGNGVWDRAAYFRSNHPGLDWANTPGLGPNVTRYETYLWEAQDAANRLPKKNSSTAGWAAYGTPQAGVCNPPGIAPDTNGIDRRRLTAAVVNCRALGKINGRRSLPVAAYMDVFLVEPTLARTKCLSGSGCGTAITGNQDIYVEIIGASGTGQGGATPQITRRSVPHLIE